MIWVVMYSEIWPRRYPQSAIAARSVTGLIECVELMDFDVCLPGCPKDVSWIERQVLCFWCWWVCWQILFLRVSLKYL